MKSNYTRNILWSLAFLLVWVLPAGCSDKDVDEPYEDGDKDIELTVGQEAYMTLAGNFFQSSEPSKGRALDEAKPSERSEIAETYESALEDFERYLPSNEREASFINRTSDGISVDLGDLGYVRFEASDGDGVVAKVTVALEDLPRYTVLYRTASSFGDNDCLRSSIGDLVRFTCPVYLKEYRRSCNTPVYGVVIQTGSQLAIFTTHTHRYSKSDLAKKIDFEYGLVSQEGWKAIYKAWIKNRSLFMDTYDHNSNSRDISALKEIMDGGASHKYVCVEGTDIGLKFVAPYWRSFDRRMLIEDLRSGDFYAPLEYYSDGKYLRQNLDSYMCSLIKVDGSNVVTIYPKY